MFISSSDAGSASGSAPADSRPPSPGADEQPVTPATAVSPGPAPTHPTKPNAVAGPGPEVLAASPASGGSDRLTDGSGRDVYEDARARWEVREPLVMKKAGFVEEREMPGGFVESESEAETDDGRGGDAGGSDEEEDRVSDVMSAWMALGGRA